MDNQLAKKIHEIIGRYSKLPDAILRAQCRGLGVEPEQLGREHLAELAPRIGMAVGRFTNPTKGKEAELLIAQLF